MIKRIVIAGCRDYTNYNEAKEYIDKVLKEIDKNYKIIILSGGCRGADKLGERYAKENSFSIEYYPAEWEKYGRSAGPKRNEEMAKNSDIVICFWDKQSRGTASMINCAKRYGKILRIKFINVKMPIY